MKKQLVATLIIVSLPFIFVSCVSSILKDAPPTFSKEIKLTEPTSPFIKMDTSVYPSWKNLKSGNVISIISNCSDSDSKLSNLHQIIESSLDNIKVIKEETLTLQNRPAFARNINAVLDGVEIEIQSISFKRKSCGYVASLSGKLNNLTNDRKQFDQFLNGFSFE
ncbi:hypothetical protein K2P97_03925 [bacterium]|nr:hypothetical protein [bacterium]